MVLSVKVNIYVTLFIALHELHTPESAVEETLAVAVIVDDVEDVLGRAAADRDFDVAKADCCVTVIERLPDC